MPDDLDPPSRRSHADADPPSRLARRLGLGDAVVVGIGSMLGTGVFVVFAPAAAAAGSWLLLSLALAAVVASANALSTARLASLHPESGGAYVYGRVRLSPTAGALAGYAFVAGKIASAAAAALAVGVYAWPDQARAVAVAAVVLATALDLAGIARTVRVTWVLVVALLLVLALVVVTGLADDPEPLTFDAPPDGAMGVLAAAGLLFFAFAGYARIATLGEEVRDPARTIPRAVVIALGVVLVVYTAVAVTALAVLGPDALAATTAPLVDVVEAAGAEHLTPVVRAAASVAAFAVLLNLVVGVGRTVFAMASYGDMPRALAVVDEKRSVPWRAELVVGVVVLVVALVGGLVGAVTFSAFSVLVYYAVANLSALQLDADERREPRVVAVIGLVGCLVLALSLPWRTVGVGALVLAVALSARAALLPRDRDGLG